VSDSSIRDGIIRLGRSIFERGLTSGSTGRISVRLDDGFVTTPIACLVTSSA
jgi:ribulose-5-phosphate 4-epimerase/fuculose-1-phosphate aldolase